MFYAKPHPASLVLLFVLLCPACSPVERHDGARGNRFARAKRHDTAKSKRSKIDLVCKDPLLPEMEEIVRKYERSPSVPEQDLKRIKRWLFPTMAKTSSVNPKPAKPGLKFAILMGGGGERDPRRNSFVVDFETMRDNLTKRDWNVSILFDGLNRSIPSSQMATYTNLLTTVLRSKAGKNDEMLFVFHSHGSEQKGGEKSHSIATGDKDGLSLDQLESLIPPLELKGVRIAIVDLTCFSGQTQALAAPNRCVVTLGSKDYYTVCTKRANTDLFTNRFFDFSKADLNRPVSLEEQFLAARRLDTEAPNLPHISSIPTPAMRGWDQFLSASDPDSLSRVKAMDSGVKAIEVLMSAEKDCSNDELIRWISIHYRALTLLADAALQDSLRDKIDRLEKTCQEYFQLEGQLDEATARSKDLYEPREWKNLPHNPEFQFLKHASLVEMEDALNTAGLKYRADRVPKLTPEVSAQMREIMPPEKYQMLKDATKDEMQELETQIQECGSLISQFAKKGHEVMERERGLYDELFGVIPKQNSACNCFEF